MKRTLIAVAAFAASSGATITSQAADHATVVSTTPVIGSVAVPRQSCVDTQQLVPPRTSGAGSLIGAIAGGVLGNTIGHGFGRAAATGIGVIAGSAVGNKVEANANIAANGGVDSVPVRRCRTVGVDEQRVIGYDVSCDYAGQRYTTRMANPPGARIAIDVRPQVEAGVATYSTARPSYGAVPIMSNALPPTYGTAVPVHAPVHAPVRVPIYAPVYAPVQPAVVDGEPAVYEGPPVVYVRPAIGYGYGHHRGWGYGRWH